MRKYLIRAVTAAFLAASLLAGCTSVTELKESPQTEEAAESAKEAERGIVDIDTLKHTNESLISTLDEVLKIQTEGKAKRREAEVELAQIENQLKEKLLQAAKN